MIENTNTTYSYKELQEEGSIESSNRKSDLLKSNTARDVETFELTSNNRGLNKIRSGHIVGSNTSHKETFESHQFLSEEMLDLTDVLTCYLTTRMVRSSAELIGETLSVDLTHKKLIARFHRGVHVSHRGKSLHTLTILIDQTLGLEAYRSVVVKYLLLVRVRVLVRVLVRVSVFEYSSYFVTIECDMRDRVIRES